LGTPESPVFIHSSDSSANGFTVLQAQGKSVLNNVIFEHLNTLDYKGWTLTGAVTFYESDIEADNISIVNNHSEDALNFIRCHFTVRDTKFENIYSDAFDSDFSDGFLSNAHFQHIGNDGIDFSGSKVKIKNYTIIDGGDKGISGGEMSNMQISNSHIEGCNIGISCKDLSELDVDSIEIKSCKYGIAVYRKKIEYGPAKLHLSNFNYDNIENLFWIEEGSSLIWDRKVIKGDKKDPIKTFYPYLYKP
jgi:hypothetical protein